MEKSDLLAYYRSQTVDKERMYTKPFRRYQQRRRLEVTRELVQKVAEDKGAHSIVDVGCGDGYGSSLVLKDLDYSRFVGLDLSPQKLYATCENIPGSQVIMGDAEMLPFSDESFDLALSLETLEHLIAPDRALGEISRLLKPGGTLIVSVPLRSRVNAFIDRRSMRRRQGRAFQEHLQVYTLRDLTRQLESAGLRRRRYRFCVFNYPCFEIMTRLIPYDCWRAMDKALSRLPFGFLGIKFGLSFGLGSEYLVMRAEKIHAAQKQGARLGPHRCS